MARPIHKATIIIRFMPTNWIAGEDNVYYDNDWAMVDGAVDAIRECWR